MIHSVIYYLFRLFPDYYIVQKKNLKKKNLQEFFSNFNLIPSIPTIGRSLKFDSWNLDVGLYMLTTMWRIGDHSFMFNNIETNFETMTTQHEHDLVDLEILIPTIKTDIKYATNDNFMNLVVYPSKKAYLCLEVAKQLKLVQDEFIEIGLCLKVWDAYRPLSVQKMLWNSVSIENRKFVADPAKGSNHNRGAAIDVTLIDLDTNQELEMPTPFDEFSTKSYSNATNESDNISILAIKNRKILNDIMLKYGFEQLPHEWWHFNYCTCSSYPVLDLNFDDI